MALIDLKFLKSVEETRLTRHFSVRFGPTDDNTIPIALQNREFLVAFDRWDSYVDYTTFLQTLLRKCGKTVALSLHSLHNASIKMIPIISG
jgi:hypothetical protein